MPVPPKRERGTQWLTGVGRPPKSETRDQRRSANQHRLASTRDKLASEAATRRRSAVPASLASTEYSHFLPIKTFENGTLSNGYTSIAHSCELPQGVLNRLKTSDLRFYIGNLGFGPCPNGSAGCPPRHTERQ